MENLEKYSETPQQLFEKAQQAVADNNRYQAATLFLDAAVKGHCEAQYRVGDCYYNGFGFTKNYEEAVKWYLAAATQGSAKAQFMLSECHHWGRGAEESDEKAVEWLRKSAEQGYAVAQDMLGWYYDGGENGLEKTISKPLSGTPWRQIRAMPKLSTISVFAITTVRE